MNEDVAKMLLYKAIECIPNRVKFWISLANLETYEMARNTLNKARKTIQLDSIIWVDTAKFEEANMVCSEKIDENY